MFRKVKASVVLNVALVSFLLTGVFISATMSGASEADPWFDVNDDGYVGVDDIVETAEHFGEIG